MVPMIFEKEKVLSSQELYGFIGTVENDRNNKMSKVREFLYEFTVRTMDIVFSLLILVIAVPILLLIALLIKLDSPGPVIFRHRRVGYNRRKISKNSTEENEQRIKESFGKPFILYKFRTMYADARERFPELYEYDYSKEELQSLPIKVLVATKSEKAAKAANESKSNDPRLTRIGRWLRRTSLDELPNFINVLKGDMHLVGPRPDIHENIKYYTKRELRIFDVKPGITGLAQIEGRGMLSFHEINERDLEYVENRSFLLDIKILFKTLIVCLRGEGAY